MIGQTINTNSAWLGQQLNELGVQVLRVLTIADERSAILESLATAGKRADWVIVTGGLGPTRDDITKKTLAEYFETQLVRRPEVLARIESRFAERGLPVLESNRSQADLPGNCEVLPNDKGTASGMWFERDGTTYISMPGVPHEMKGIFNQHLRPRILNTPGRQLIVHRTVMTRGIGESLLADKLEDWEDRVRNAGLGLAYLPNTGIVKLRLSAYGNLADAETQIEQFINELRNLIPEHLFALREVALEKRIGEVLFEKGCCMAIAESCTGGFLAHKITSVPGCSAYFLGSVTAYDNRIKQDLLHVSAADLETHGAVSEPVARQMAEGLRKTWGADYTIATTGIAGPDGGSDEKPVGTVCYAVAGPNGTIVKTGRFGRNRQRVVERSSVATLSLLYNVLEKDFNID